MKTPSNFHNHQCLYCNGTGQITPPYADSSPTKPYDCYGCYCRGWVTEGIFKMQMVYSKKSNLELIELYEKAK